MKSFIQNSLLSNDELLVSKKRMAGDKDRFLEHGNLKTHFIDAINLFEDYICDIAIINYSYRPEKMGDVPLDAKKNIQINL
ncbi:MULTISPECIES: hypothetical protein [Vagococcus]|uniref:Uncharacterized protein n=1 Tax=Vagococcus luciliae TaxID=2920380 RepID=A0ABY5P011_9ENTE|nr:MULTISPECIES: hypothetical protein [Vagococcus]MCI0130020.1 hypothetical protein [Vagococcus sp. CY53-2]UUV99153.1 hypothetical protein G314FT_13130 [Vagococcus luciliae]